MKKTRTVAGLGVASERGHLVVHQYAMFAQPQHQLQVNQAIFTMGAGPTRGVAVVLAGGFMRLGVLPVGQNGAIDIGMFRIVDAIAVEAAD